ncbi:putative leucine-rich repeat-containing protein [Corchorus olitorius]|uniref:Leucine-rich repeat-containing protein n=1 Tax=Corchorus olitorius TaxID=93759 RepID=A0A1R3I2F1_9ROSI|nr:putative leucine-rich repeat-containing protein [Corchorus olitorius]
MRLGALHEDFDRQLTEVEENLVRIYSSVVEEMGDEDQVNEEVVSILKEAENDVVAERVELSGRHLKILPEAFGKLHDLVYLNFSQNQLQLDAVVYLVDAYDKERFVPMKLLISAILMG